MVPSTLSNSVSVVFGKKRYELSDWLGNVRVVINDRKMPVNIGTTTVGYKAQVINVNDYYSYGSTINERTYDYSSTKFRFAFNGKELDNEVYGFGNFQDYGARMYNTRLGRFISPDPIIITEKKYPWYSSYQFAGNKPTIAIDLDGKEDIWTHTTEFANGFKVSTTIIKGDDVFEMTKQSWAMQMGMDPNKLPQSGSLNTYQKYDASGKVASTLMFYNPGVEVTASKQWSSLANEIGHYLENSKFKEVNDAFVGRYYGEAGQERFLGDLEKESTYIKTSAVIIGAAGAVTGQPEIVAVGMELYALGGRMEDVGTVIKGAKYLSKGDIENASIEGVFYITGRTLERAADLQKVPQINKLLFNYSKDKLLDTYKEDVKNQHQENEKR
jgi:RHS repeat-associated protein